MVKYLAIIQARINSSRLPAKVMLDLGGKTLVERVYESVLNSKRLDKIVVAISDKISDDILAYKLSNLGIEYYRGDLNNVLKRFYDTAVKYNAQNIVRITADNPLMDGYVIDSLIDMYELKNCDYSMYSNAVYGLSTEVFSFKSLQKAYQNAQDDFDKEHVTPYIKKHCKCCIDDIEDRYKFPHFIATIDTLDDYIAMNKFYSYCIKHNYNPNIDTFVEYYKKNR